MKFAFFASFAILLLLSGCGSNSDSKDSSAISKCAVEFSEHNDSVLGEDDVVGNWKATESEKNGAELFLFEMDSNGTGRLIDDNTTKSIMYSVVPSIELLVYSVNDNNHTLRLLEKIDERCYIAAWHLDMFNNKKINFCKVEN